MPDADLRATARRAARSEDPIDVERLAVERSRVGLCPGCGLPDHGAALLCANDIPEGFVPWDATGAWRFHGSGGHHGFIVATDPCGRSVVWKMTIETRAAIVRGSRLSVERVAMILLPGSQAAYRTRASRGARETAEELVRKAHAAASVPMAAWLRSRGFEAVEDPDPDAKERERIRVDNPVVNPNAPELAFGDRERLFVTWGEGGWVVGDDGGTIVIGHRTREAVEDTLEAMGFHQDSAVATDDIGALMEGDDDIGSGDEDP